jgi:protease YdgD
LPGKPAARPQDEHFTCFNRNLWESDLRRKWMSPITLPASELTSEGLLMIRLVINYWDRESMPCTSASTNRSGQPWNKSDHDDCHRLRRRAIAAIANVVLLLMLTGSLVSKAFSRDAIIVDANVPPWSSVGKIYNGAGSSCTGSLIAADKVLTAAHCLFNRATHRLLQATSLHFLLGYEAGEYRAHARIANYLIEPNYQPQQAGKSISSDWAILVLGEPFASDTTPLPLADGPSVAGERIMIGGYSRQHPFKMTADIDCRLQDVMLGGLLVHDCAVMQGDSGAPLLRRTGETSVQIIGLQVATRELMGSKVGFALPISSVAHQLSLSPQ